MSSSNNKRIKRADWDKLCHVIRNDIPVIRKRIKDQISDLKEIDERCEEIENTLNELQYEDNHNGRREKR